MMDDRVTHDPLFPAAPAPQIRNTRVQRCAARIVAINDLTHDTIELVIRRDPGGPNVIARAGQFATLTIPGIAQPRAYSFARDPAAEQAGEHTFQIRLVPGGEMSTWLKTENRVGLTLEFAGPLGRFGLDNDERGMVLFAGGSGLSAIKAIAEEAARMQVPRNCLVLHGARQQQDLHSGESIGALADNWHEGYRFEFVQILSDEPADSKWAGPRGLITDYFRETWLEPGLLRAGDFRSWVCGPPPMINAAQTMLTQAGVADADIDRDVFEDRSSPAPVIDDRRCVLCDECLLVRPVADCIIETGASGEGAPALRRIEPLKTAGLYYNGLVINADACIRCSACVQVCPHDAISVPFK